MVAVWLVVFALLGLPPVARGAGTAYVLTGRDEGDIAQYAIQADGQLSPLSAGIVNTVLGSRHGRDAGWPVGVRRSRSGILQYDIDPVTGALSPKSPALIPRPGDDAFPTRHGRISERQECLRNRWRAARRHSHQSVRHRPDDRCARIQARPRCTGSGDAWALLITPDGKSAYVTDIDVGRPAPLQRRRAVRHRSDQRPIVREGPRDGVDRPVPGRRNLRPGVATLTPDGKNVYVLNNGRGYTPNDRIAQFDVDATTGELSPKTPASVVTGPNAVFIVVTPDSASAYVSSFGPPPIPGPSPDPVGPGSIWQYDIDPATGALAPKSPPTVETGGNPAGSAVTPDGRTAYVTEPRQGVVRLYDVDPESGALTPKANSTHHHRRQSRSDRAWPAAAGADGQGAVPAEWLARFRTVQEPGPLRSVRHAVRSLGRARERAIAYGLSVG